MFRNIIAPVQAWLLSQGKCVGCGKLLPKAVAGAKKVSCKCGRVYVIDNASGKFRRAQMDEA